MSLLDKCAAATIMEEVEVGSVPKPHMRDQLTSGYKLSIKANVAYALRDYQLAADLHADAIKNSCKPATLLQEA